MFYIKSMHSTPLYSDVNIGGYKFLDLHLLGPVIAYGEEGEQGQVLTAQGGNKPPKWETPSGGSGGGIYGGSGSIPANTVATISSGNFTFDYSSGADAIKINNSSNATIISAPDGLAKTTVTNGNIQLATDDYLFDLRDGVGTTFTDGGTGHGITYTADYSAGFTSRSLTDKAYVDAAIVAAVPSFTAGSVVFSNGTTIAQDNANLFWDDTNNRLGIGTNLPDETLTISGNSKVNGFTIIPSYASAFDNSKNHSLIYASATGGGSFPFTENGNLIIQSRSSGADRDIVFATNGVTPTIRMIIGRLGSVSIGGNSSPTTSRLIVSDAVFAGSGSLAGSLLDLTQTWNTTGVPTAIKLNVTDTASSASSLLMDLQVGGTSMFNVPKTGIIVARGLSLSSQDYIRFNQRGYINYNQTSSVSANGAIRFDNSSTNLTPTAGTATELGVGTTFNPTSGTAMYNTWLLNPVINQTGGANGITRGIYINSTITAAADWRAIETSQGALVMNDTYLSGSGALARSLVYLTQTWNTTGTPTAIKLNVTDTASNASSLLMDLQVGGTSMFTLSKSGVGSFASSLYVNGTTFRVPSSGAIFFNTRSMLTSAIDGNLRLTNNAQTDFGLLQFGGTTSSYPAIKRSSTELQIRLADDSGHAGLSASYVEVDTTVTAGGTTGDQTINKMAGSVNFAAGALSSITVTNSLVTTGSLILATVMSKDATMTSVQAVIAGAGSFRLYPNASPTSETKVAFWVINPA